MSDSEEDTSFASADEGESSAQDKSHAKTTDSSNKTKESDEKSHSGGIRAAGAKSSESEPKTDKGKKHQSKQRKKGKSSPNTESTSKPNDKKPLADKHVKSTEKASSPEAKFSESKKTKDTKTHSESDVKGTTTDKSKVSENVEKASSIKTAANTETATPVKAANTETATPVNAAKTETANPAKAESSVTETSKKNVASPQSQEITADVRDHHSSEQEEVLKRLQESTQQNQSSGWGWGWGSSLISAATNSVQTFTKEVGDGLSTIMDSVESTLGVPDPEQLAVADNCKETDSGVSEPTVSEQKKTEEQQTPTEETSAKATDSVVEPTESMENKQAETNEGSSWFSSWGVGDIAKKMQNTGRNLAAKGQTLMSDGFDAVEKVAAGGIDVLETIGKKTYDTLSEHDPAFRRTREYLLPKTNKPNLSNMLKEAKDKADKDAELEKENEELRKAHFGTLFDDYQGIAHLEALEILSNQSEKKLHSLLNSLSSKDLSELKPILLEIKQSFELDEDDVDAGETKEQDFNSLVSQHLSELQLGTGPDKLNKVHDMVKQWIEDFETQTSGEDKTVKTVHQQSIQALAELTAKGVEQFHKAGELVLLQKDADKDCRERSQSLARLTGVLCHEIGNLASKFVVCLNRTGEKSEDCEEVTPLVTNVYLEATNSSTYIQDAFQLLLPVLQQAAVEHVIRSRES